MTIKPVAVPSLTETDPTRTNTAIRQLYERAQTIGTDLDNINAAIAALSAAVLHIDAPQTITAPQQLIGRNNLAINATNTPFTPAGNIASNNVQAGMQELDTEKVAKAGDTMTGSLTLSNGSLTISNGSIFFNSPWATNFVLDVTGRTAVVGAGGLIVIETNFSGLILVDNWVTGAITGYICGGAIVYPWGASGDTVCAYAAPQNGYSVSNTSGATGTYSTAAIRLRPGA